VRQENMQKSFVVNVAGSLNGFYRRLRLGDVGIPCKISPFATFKGLTGSISIGHDTLVNRDAYFECDKNGSIQIGSHCEIHSYARIMTYGGHISIGDYSSVNPYTILYGHGGLTIGSMVRIAAQVVIIPANHGIESTSEPIYKQGIIGSAVTIKDDVWIGTGVKILGGVTINSGAVIAAGAVVTRDVPQNAIMGGVPARVIRFRGDSAEIREIT